MSRLTAGPVRLWAVAGCLGLWVPAVVAGSQQRAQLRITAPTEADQPASSLVVTALTRAGSAPIVEVEAFVNDESLGARTEPPWRWETSFAAAPPVLFVRVVLRDAEGDEVTDEVTLTDASVASFALDVPAVAVNLGVFDRRGSPIADLRREEVVVRDRGRAQEILEFGREEVPVRVVMLLDRSDSMDDSLAEARAAVEAFVGHLAPQDHVKLVAFNHRVQALTDFTTDAEEAVRALSGVRGDGGTALFDALLMALADFDGNGGLRERRAVLLFSDGWDQHSVNSLQRVFDRVRSTDATVYSIGHGEALDNGDLRRTLEDIAEATGGRAYFERRPERLRGIFASVAREIRALYFLSFVPDNPAPGWHELEVEVTRRRTRVRHKLGYQAEGGGQQP